MYHPINNVHLISMKESKRIFTANDNSPSQAVEMHALNYGNNFFSNSFKSATKSVTGISELHVPDMVNGANNSPNSKHKSLKVSVLFWLSALILGLINIFGETSTEIKAFSALALLWAGLWTSYVAADHNKWRLSELAIISSLGGLMSAIIIGTNYLGLNLTLIDGIILMSLLSVAMGYILKSRIAVLTSICTTLLWAIISFMGLEPINNIAILFPVLTGLQIYAGSRIQSKLAITLAVMTNYYGLVGFLAASWIHNLIPLSYASALLFIIGVAHHRGGKAADDSQVSGSNIHIYFGWIMAVTSAVFFQYFWLSQDAAAAWAQTEINPTTLGLWKITVSLSVLAIFISGIIRFKYTQITLTGIFLLTIFSGLIPLMMWFPSWPETLAASIPGINAVPAFGIAIGAAIVAASIGFIINGIRRKANIMIFLGLLFIGIEMFLLMDPGLMTPDHIIVFSVSLLTAFSVGGVIAGNSLASQAPPPRLKQNYA